MNGMPLKDRVPYGRRWWARILLGAAAIIIIVGGLSYFISNETLRRYMEHQINSSMKGYRVHVGRAYFHPLAFSLLLRDLTLTQDANPNPPIANIGRLYASVHWRALLNGHLVGDLLIDQPKLYINLTNIRKEAESKVPLKEEGWQQAVESIYPLKINVFKINNGIVTYVDKGPYQPLRLSRVIIEASNIRNIRFPEKVYPSIVHLEATIFDKGRLTLDGRANFLEEPHLGLKADVDVADMDLSYFAPITNRGNVSVRKGTLSARGALEYAPPITEVNLKNLEIEGADIDYLHLPQTVEAERQRAQEAAHAAGELSNEPTTKIRADVLTIKESKFGYLNKTSRPNYRLFIDHLEVALKHFSNQSAEGPATLDLKGKFMGTGDTQVTGTFRPETKGADFTVKAAIENTQMAAMSDLFRAFGNFDVKEGLFSVYADLTVKDEAINGYVKPLFKDLQVYDRRSAQEKSLFHKLYVGIVGGVAKLLENRARGEVATKATLSGPVENPNFSTGQIILNLIRNAFIKSILPGFEKAVGQSKSGRSSQQR
jgi:Domain of Unknown Function (DUF748)